MDANLALYQIRFVPEDPNQTPVPPSPHPRPGLRPRLRMLYSFDAHSSTWRATKLRADISTALGSTFGILTWNIDFSGPLPIPRFQAVLSLLEQLFSPGDANSTRSVLPPPTIILLQEFHKACFPTLLSSPFIREQYALTGVAPSDLNFNSSFGLLTLVPKSLSGHVTSIFRSPLPATQMGRDALYVDFGWTLASQPSITKWIRIANTHLESLPGHGDRVRPAQMQSISEFLSSPGVSGGLVGGDMNAISPSDVNIHEAVGLTDAWDTLGEDDESLGHTWGYQPPTVFPPGRLDKVLFNGCLRVKQMERVGIGLKEGQSWVSDHYALFAHVIVD